MPSVRKNVLPIRLTPRERQQADRLAERLGLPLASVFRQGMLRLYHEIFREQPHERR